MEEQVSPNWIVIDRDGNAFLAVDYLDKIPTWPPDHPVKDRFFNETVEVAIPGPASVSFGPQLFVSVNTLNMLLASASTNPLHARVATEVTKDGYNRVFMRLEDFASNEVPFSDLAHDDLEDLRALVRDEEEQPVIDTPNLPQDNHGDHHDTPCESVDRVRDEQARLGDEPQHHGFSDSNPVVENNDDYTTTSQSRLPNGDVLDATPLRPRDHPIPDDNVGDILSHQDGDGRPYGRALVKQLRDLQLTDNATLNALLHDRLPPALDKLKLVEDDHVHLATLSDGQVCSFRIFRGLYARREDLSFLSLADPSLAHRPITHYQKVELLKILYEVSHNPRTRADTWPPPSHPASLPSMCQNLLSLSYQNVGQFERNLDLLAAYVGGGTEAAAARSRAVDEIKTMMRARCAISSGDMLDPLYNGLLREVVIPGAAAAATGAEQPPLRFVLPLGRLYRAGAHDARPRPLDCFVLLDVASPQKALWLLRRSCEGRSDLVALADDISLWKLGSRRDNRDGGLVRRRVAAAAAAAAAAGGDQPSAGERALLRARLMKEYPESLVQLEPDAVRFRRVDKQRAVVAIRRGWSVVVSPPAVRSPGRTWAQKSSPLRTALLNSTVARILQESPSRKRGREEGSLGETVPDDGGSGVVQDDDDSGSDEEWLPASERKRTKRTSGGRRSAGCRS